MSAPSPITLRKPICYFDGITEVRLGDIVTARVWCIWKKKGRVVYVPGISKMNPEFEHHGLSWIAVKTDDGMVFGDIVRPETGCLKKGLKFVARDGSPCDLITPETTFPE